MTEEYGLCIQDCIKCEFHSGDGCGLNYDGEPMPTFKELVILMLVLISIPIIFIMLGYFKII